MTKQEIYNTLKTKQLNHAINACEWAIDGKLDLAKSSHNKSVALLDAIKELCGDDYNGYKVLNSYNLDLLDKWHDLETKRLNQ